MNIKHPRLQLLRATFGDGAHTSLLLCASWLEPGAEGNGPGIQETLGNTDFTAFAAWSRAGLTNYPRGWR